MLEVLGRFLPSLVVLPSVERIGLTGSITTPKREPKDIDVVVCTKEGADLTQLAAIYRKMSGRFQSMGWGVDVFIFENGSYIGRPCPYRECAPGIRLSCTADHCGRRPYLRDDLIVIELYSTTLTRLPVLLHPHGWCMDDVPDDVKEFVRRTTSPEGGRDNER
jgi:predicted nucleotidyltransferase